MTATLAPRFPSFSGLLETVRYYWFLYTPPSYQGHRYMCTRVDSFFECVLAHTSVCLRREAGGWAVCHLLIGRSSLGAKGTTSPSAFPFQTDSTLLAIKQKKTSIWRKRLRISSTCVFLLIENRRTRFSFRSSLLFDNVLLSKRKIIFAVIRRWLN